MTINKSCHKKVQVFFSRHFRRGGRLLLLLRRDTIDAWWLFTSWDFIYFWRRHWKFPIKNSFAGDLLARSTINLTFVCTFNMSEQASKQINKRRSVAGAAIDKFYDRLNAYTQKSIFHFACNIEFIVLCPPAISYLNKSVKFIFNF